MTVEERISAADRRKMDGNAFFKEEKLEEAMQQYEMVQARVLECSYSISHNQHELVLYSPPVLTYCG